MSVLRRASLGSRGVVQRILLEVRVRVQLIRPARAAVDRRGVGREVGGAFPASLLHCQRRNRQSRQMRSRRIKTRSPSSILSEGRRLTGLTSILVLRWWRVT